MLGQPPIYISTLLQMVKYYAHSLKQNSGNLLYEAYKESLLLSNDNKDSWMNFMKHLLETVMHVVKNLIKIKLFCLGIVHCNTRSIPCDDWTKAQEEPVT